MYDVRNKRVVVVGLGRTARALTQLLLREGAQVLVSEFQPRAEDDAAVLELRALGAEVETGGHSAPRFEAADYVIPSPGVSPAIAPIAAAAAAGAPVISELEYAWKFARGRIFAVTGTNGKTTVTEMVHALLLACGVDSVLAGNNAYPMSQAVLEHPDAEVFVVEASSYQLDLVRTFHPEIAVVLNLTEDHLARHGTMAGYAAAKAKIFAAQQAGDIAIVNADDAHTLAMPIPRDVERVEFSLKGPVEDGLWSDGGHIFDGDAVIATRDDLPLPGAHNLANALAALAVLRWGGFEWRETLAGLRTFRGVEHRIEFVAELDGVRWYNDSKATNVDSLRVALESFSGNLVLIAGGEGKGADYRVLRPLIASRVVHLIGMGADGPIIAAAFEDAVPVQVVGTMPEAVAAAREAARPGDTVLLSPACASFDQYKNFEERGRHFKACVESLQSEEVLR